MIITQYVISVTLTLVSRMRKTISFHFKVNEINGGFRPSGDEIWFLITKQFMRSGHELYITPEQQQKPARRVGYEGRGSCMCLHREMHPRYSGNRHLIFRQQARCLNNDYGSEVPT